MRSLPNYRHHDSYDDSLWLDRIPQIFGGLLVLSVALIASTLIGAKAFRAAEMNHEVTVKGTARKTLRADFVVWRTSLSSQQPTLPRAFQELRRYASRTIAYLKQQNIPAGSIALGAIQTNPIPEILPSGNPTGRILSYRLTQTIEVRSADIDPVTVISRNSTSLILEGIPIVSEPPEYFYLNRDLGKLRLELLGDATRDARSRAEALVQNAGGNLGVLRRAEVSDFQIATRYAGGKENLSPEKEVSTTVAASFAMK